MHFRTPFYSVVKLTPKSSTIKIKSQQPLQKTSTTRILSVKESPVSPACMIYSQHKVVVDVIMVEGRIYLRSTNLTKRKQNRVQLKRLLSYASQQLTIYKLIHSFVVTLFSTTQVHKNLYNYTSYVQLLR